MPQESMLMMTPREDVPKGFRVIQFKGTLDENTSMAARANLDTLLQGREFAYLVFDMSELSYINSKGIGFLVSVHAHISKDKKKLVLTGSNEAVNDVLMLVGISSIIDCLGSLPEAFQTLS